MAYIQKNNPLKKPPNEESVKTVGVNENIIDNIETREYTGKPNDNPKAYIESNKHIEDQIKWDSSDRAKEMLGVSVNNPGDAEYIARARIDNLNSATSRTYPTTESYPGGNSYGQTGGKRIDINAQAILEDRAYFGDDVSVQNTGAHEASHVSDILQPDKDYHGIQGRAVKYQQKIPYLEGETIKNNLTQSVSGKTYLIPKSDRDLMRSLAVDPIKVKSSETRAMINTGRAAMGNAGVDLYNKKVTPKDIDGIRGKYYYKRLLKSYKTDANILKLFNTISANKDGNKSATKKNYT